MSWVMGLLIFSALAGVSLYRGYVRAKDLRALVARGVRGRATIVARRRFDTKAGRRRLIVYEYVVDGHTRRARSWLGGTQFDAFAEGQDIPIRYLPERHDVVAPEFLVEQARAAGQSMRTLPPTGGGRHGT